MFGQKGGSLNMTFICCIDDCNKKQSIVQMQYDLVNYLNVFSYSVTHMYYSYTINFNLYSMLLTLYRNY